jgi:hypothetical protein
VLVRNVLLGPSMKTAALSLLTALPLFACATDGDPALEPTDVPGGLDKADNGSAHYRASYCEVFLDRVTPYVGSHGIKALEVYVKTLNDRLDARVVEVGFRAQVRAENGVVTTDWRNYPANTFPGAADYFELSLPISSDFGTTIREGAFYVKTAANTYYWAKLDAGNGNFLFDQPEFGALYGAAGYFQSANFSPAWDRGIDTRTTDAGRALNPSGCQ